MEDEIMIEIPIKIKPEILVSWATAIQTECRKNKICNECVFYDRDENYPICVLMMRSPEDWALKHLSQLNQI